MLIKDGWRLQKVISVDGDLYPNKKISKEAIEITIDFLNLFRIKNVTWFINMEYPWDTEYKKQLLMILLRGDKIGLHSHRICKDMRAGKHSSIKELVKEFGRDKKRLEKVVGKVISFRSGAHAYTPEMFKALERLGFKYDHSVIRNQIVYVDKKLYPNSKVDIYVDNRGNKELQYKIGKLVEVTNHKWDYFHPIDLVDKNGEVKWRNIIKYGILL